jgi:hypothetical protein
MSNSVFYNFALTNDSDIAIPVDKTDTPYTEMLPKASDYGVSVIKFTLPNEAETFRILDSSYRVALSAPIPMNPLSFATFEVPMATRDEFQIKCIADFLENLNRTLIECHNGLIKQISTTLGTMTQVNPVPSVSSLITADADFRATQTVTLNFGSTIPKATRMSFLECGFRISVPNDGLNVTPPYLTCFLVSPAGVSITLTANRKLAFGGTSTPFYNFSDEVLLQSTTTFDSLPFNNAPLEPFSKLLTNNDSSSSSTGDWRMVFQFTSIYTTPTASSTCRRFTLEARVNHIASPAYSTGATGVSALTTSRFPYIAPAFSFDQSTKSISMIFQDRAPLAGYNVLFSPKLYNIMPFPGKIITVGSVTGYAISIPQSAYTANTNPPLPDTLDGTFYKSSIYPAPNPNDSYKLLDIRTVIIKTNLMTQAEQESTTNQRILMSLDVTGSDYFSNLYQFSSNNINTRTYQILDDLPLTRLGISVFFKYRTTGELVQAYLPPHTTFTILLKFSPKGSFS